MNSALLAPKNAGNSRHAGVGAWRENLLSLAAFDCYIEEMEQVKKTVSMSLAWTVLQPQLCWMKEKDQTRQVIHDNKKSCIQTLSRTEEWLLEKGSPAFLGGTIIPPTKVNIIRPSNASSFIAIPPGSGPKPPMPPMPRTKTR
jgi:hypothetical protein